MKDVAKIAEKTEGINYTFHDFGKIPGNSCEKIDFIFVTPQIKVSNSFIPKETEGRNRISFRPQSAFSYFDILMEDLPNRR